MNVVPWGNYWLPMLPMPNVLVAGLPGSGKTLFLRLLMQAILQQSNCRSMVYDPKRELIQYIDAMAPGRKIHILDPTDRDSSAWDVAADFPDHRDAPTLAGLFVNRRTEKSASGEFFEGAEKTVMTAIIRGLQRRAPGRWDLRDVILAALDESVAQQLIGNDCFAIAYLNKLKTATEAGQNVWLSFIVSLAKFEALAALWHNAKTKFSIKRDWMTNPSICVLGVSQADPEIFAPFNRTLLRRMKECLLGQPEHPASRTCVVLDELPTLGNVADVVGEILRMGRSKRVGVLTAFQDINTLHKEYTESGGKGLLSNFSEVAVFRCQMETAEWAAKLFGQTRWRRWTESYDPDPPSNNVPGAPYSPPSTKSTYQEHFEDDFLVRPTDFTDLPKPSKSAGVGLNGFLWSALYGRMKLSISSEELSRRLILPTPGTRDAFIPRCASDYELKAWEESELERLGFVRQQPQMNQDIVRPSDAKRERSSEDVDLRDFY